MIECSTSGLSFKEFGIIKKREGEREKRKSKGERKGKEEKREKNKIKKKKYRWLLLHCAF